MSETVAEFDASLARENLAALAENPYPGRLIVMGVAPSGDEAVQVYAVMGRRDNSRNRVLVQDGDTIKTEPLDPDKVENPNLIIYTALADARGHEVHIVSNGDQTDAVVRRMKGQKSPFDCFQGALFDQEFEPDPPNYTSRITGMLVQSRSNPEFNGYNYSIIRRNKVTGQSEYTFGGGSIDQVPAGSGICYHTYKGDGNPLPPFEGSPYAVPIEAGNAQEAAKAFWDVLDRENRVAIVAKTINMTTGIVGYRIINAHEE